LLNISEGGGNVLRLYTTLANAKEKGRRARRDHLNLRLPGYQTLGACYIVSKNLGIAGNMRGKAIEPHGVETSRRLLLLVSDPRATLTLGDLQLGATQGWPMPLRQAVKVKHCVFGIAVSEFPLNRALMTQSKSYCAVSGSKVMCKLI
jgi:hypothetical protein